MTKESVVASQFMRNLEERRKFEELGEKLEKLSYERGIGSLTETVERGWYDDSWSVTRTDWAAVAKLFKELAPEVLINIK